MRLHGNRRGGGTIAPPGNPLCRCCAVFTHRVFPPVWESAQSHYGVGLSHLSVFPRVFTHHPAISFWRKCRFAVEHRGSIGCSRIRMFSDPHSPHARRHDSGRDCKQAFSVAATQNCACLAVVAPSTAQVERDRIQRRFCLFLLCRSCGLCQSRECGLAFVLTRQAAFSTHYG